MQELNDYLQENVGSLFITQRNIYVWFGRRCVQLSSESPLVFLGVKKPTEYVTHVLFLTKDKIGFFIVNRNHKVSRLEYFKEYFEKVE